MILDLSMLIASCSPHICWPLDSWVPVMVMEKTMWEREDCSLAAVAPAKFRVKLQTVEEHIPIQGKLAVWALGAHP